jgi:hypothetical protein
MQPRTTANAGPRRVRRQSADGVARDDWYCRAWVPYCVGDAESPADERNGRVVGFGGEEGEGRREGAGLNALRPVPPSPSIFYQ